VPTLSAKLPDVLGGIWAAFAGTAAAAVVAADIDQYCLCPKLSCIGADTIKSADAVNSNHQAIRVSLLAC